MIESKFDELTQQFSSNSLRRAIERFNNAGNNRAKRAVIQSMIDGFYKLPIDQELGLPKAGEGAYSITLTANDQMMSKKLILRLDPLKE